jgi:hypothetical protein
MGTAVVAEELPGAGELDELYQLDASETQPEPEDDEDDTDEDDTDEGGDEGGMKPEGMPHP